MNNEQMYAAKRDMENWLSDPHELGKPPKKIECAGDFELEGMHYYIFKFKSGMFGAWLLGVSGGFEGDDLVPCGHTFSDLKPYDEASAQAECIKMVEKIKNYWKEEARR